MKLKFIIFSLFIFVKSFAQNDSISVTMPDKSIFKISLQENKLLEKYKSQPEKYEFKTETELLERFKHITLKKREIAQIKAETEQREKNIAKTDAEIAQIKAETEQIKAETEQIKAETEQIQQKLNIVNQDLKQLDSQFEEIIKKQLGREITEEERKKYKNEIFIWDTWHNEATKKLGKIKETKNKTEAKKLIEEVKKQKKSDLPYINTNNEMLIKELETILK